MLRDVAIAGVYASEQQTFIDKDPGELILECVLGAMADAGVTAADIDGMAVDWPGPALAPKDNSSWATQIGHSLAWVGDSVFLTAGVRGIVQAAAAIATGQCDTVVIGGGMSGSVHRAQFATVSAPPTEFFHPWGGYVAPAFALVAQRHMHEFGTKPEHLAEVAATIRNNGSTNREAVHFGRGPYTVEDILASPMIADPFHRLDLCIVAQGGAAMVLTTLEKARDLRKAPVVIRGTGQEIASGLFAEPPIYRRDKSYGSRAIARALQAADVGIHDFDVYNLYDANSFEIIRQVEMMGLCGEGEGGPFVESGMIRSDGRYPVNLDGGCLSHAWNGTQQMTLRAIESVRQVRGDAVHQKPGVELACTSIGGPGAYKYEFAIFARA